MSDSIARLVKMENAEQTVVNVYVYQETPGANGIAGAIKWDPSQFELGDFTVSPHIMSQNPEGDLKPAGWNIVNERYSQDGFLAFLIGADADYAFGPGVIAMLKLRKRFYEADESTIAPSSWPIRWSASDRLANLLPLEVEGLS